MPVTPGGIPALDKVNAVLGQLVPGLGMVIALAELATELIRRKQSDGPEMTLDEMGQYLQVKGQSMQEFSNTWLEQHGYDAEGRKIDNPGI